MGLWDGRGNSMRKLNHCMGIRSWACGTGRRFGGGRRHRPVPGSPSLSLLCSPLTGPARRHSTMPTVCAERPSPADMPAVESSPPSTRSGAALQQGRMAWRSECPRRPPPAAPPRHATAGGQPQTQRSLTACSRRPQGCGNNGRTALGVTQRRAWQLSLYCAVSRARGPCEARAANGSCPARHRCCP